MELTQGELADLLPGVTYDPFVFKLHYPHVCKILKLMSKLHPRVEPHAPQEAMVSLMYAATAAGTLARTPEVPFDATRLRQVFDQVLLDVQAQHVCE